MYSRRIFTGINSLLHFDFPHYYAANSALKDEASSRLWAKKGNVLFAGRFPPSDLSDDNAPKFGYRCLYTQSNTDYVISSGEAFSFKSKGPHELEIFAYFKSAQAGNIISLLNASGEFLVISFSSSQAIQAVSSSWGINLVGSSVSLNTWHHIRLQVNAGIISLWVDGNSYAGANISTGLTASVTSIKIGGTHAYFDEFVLKDTISAGGVPLQPYRGALDITKAGGFGSGLDGIANISSDARINSYGKVNKKSGGINFTVASWDTGGEDGYPVIANNISQGDELMFWVWQKSNTSPDTLAGLYAFRRITSISGTAFSVDRPVSDEFDMDEALKNYYVYAYKIPHFSSFTLQAGGRLWPSKDLIAFRCTGNATWSGTNGVASTGVSRSDSWDLSHSDLPDRMLPGYACIMAFCGGTFTAGGKIGRYSAKFPGGYGGSGEIMTSTGSSSSYGSNIIIAARKLHVDNESLCHNAYYSNHFSGLCYLAGDMV